MARRPERHFHKNWGQEDGANFATGGGAGGGGGKGGEGGGGGGSGAEEDVPEKATNDMGSGYAETAASAARVLARSPPVPLLQHGVC